MHHARPHIQVNLALACTFIVYRLRTDARPIHICRVSSLLQFIIICVVVASHRDRFALPE